MENQADCLVIAIEKSQPETKEARNERLCKTNHNLTHIHHKSPYI